MKTELTVIIVGVAALVVALIIAVKFGKIIANLLTVIGGLVVIGALLLAVQTTAGLLSGGPLDTLAVVKLGKAILEVLR